MVEGATCRALGHQLPAAHLRDLAVQVKFLYVQPLRHAAMCIQNCWRKFHAHRLNEAASRIQSLVRGYMVRRWMTLSRKPPHGSDECKSRRPKANTHALGNMHDHAMSSFTDRRERLESRPAERASLEKNEWRGRLLGDARLDT